MYDNSELNTPNLVVRLSSQSTHISEFFPFINFTIFADSIEQEVDNEVKRIVQLKKGTSEGKFIFCTSAQFDDLNCVV